MVKIEYSPNNRAWCQSCHHKILSDQIRVSVKASSPYQRGAFINQYHHANCYHNRKDFTKFYGFYSLTAEDQKRFLTEEQKRIMFPGDYVEKAIDTAAGGGASGAVDRRKAMDTSGKGAGNDESAQQNQQQQQKQEQKGPPELTLTVTGLKYAPVKAAIGQKVMLVREPENKYDANAVKVTNIAGQMLGHIKKEEACKLSPLLAKMEAAGKIVADCTVLTGGDGYSQRIRVIFKKKEEEKKSAVGRTSIGVAMQSPIPVAAGKKPSVVSVSPKVASAAGASTAMGGKKTPTKLFKSDTKKREATSAIVNPYSKKKKSVSTESTK